MITEQRNERGYFEGWQGRECGEHRTVGAHRAWCLICDAWCYPGRNAEMACSGCELPIVRAERDRLRAQVQAVRECIGQMRLAADMARAAVVPAGEPSFALDGVEEACNNVEAALAGDGKEGSTDE